jgi:threonine dehydrogenase-like Zn-dependent dehydrogenase
MKAIVKVREEAGAVEVRDLPMPEPGPGETLVKMGASGICYSDVMIYKGLYKGRSPLPFPLIMGHEGAGVVAGLGQGVTNLRIGDKVSLNPIWGCGHCGNCLNAAPNMCTSWTHLGITRDGTFAEYLTVPAFAAFKVPDSVSMIDAACIEPINLAVRTFEHIKPQLAETVAIVGPGAIGLFHVQAFKAAGAAKVIVIGLDQDAKRFEMAKNLGADYIINGSKSDVVKEVRDLTGGLGCDIVVEAANHPSTVGLAINLAAAQGRVMLFGLYPEATISPLNMVRSGLQVWADTASIPRWFRRGIRWVEYKKVTAEPIVSRPYRLDEVNEAFEAFRAGEAAKILFVM